MIAGEEDFWDFPAFEIFRTIVDRVFFPPLLYDIIKYSKMRRKEFEQDILTDHSSVDRQIVEGLNRILGGNVRFHYTAGWSYEAHGGVHETKEEAQSALKNFSGKPGLPKEIQTGSAEIIYLNEGDRYRIWGSTKRYVHGENDGTHGSKKI